jgi:hypothetical protein
MHTTLQRWLMSLPEDVRRALPSFNFGHGLSLLLLGQIQQFERLLDTAEAELAVHHNPRALGELTSCARTSRCRAWSMRPRPS